jgi:hypothetical protein
MTGSPINWSAGLRPDIEAKLGGLGRDAYMNGKLGRADFDRPYLRKLRRGATAEGGVSRRHLIVPEVRTKDGLEFLTTVEGNSECTAAHA